MKKRIPEALRAVLLAALLAAPVAAVTPAADLAYYLPAEVAYAPEVPKPKDVLGFEVGEWHVRHDQLVAYLTALAASSERLRIETVGRTHEARPLVHLTVSAPENLARLEEILAVHRRLSDPQSEKPETATMPVVVYLGYSVHGNEASGANAALLVAYHLAAARGEAIDRLLREAVIVLDPSLNPDGLGRFAQWANMHRGRVLVADRHHREHREPWPNGRTNHYWFDLNRDWLLAQHPETRARLARFHRLRPNVVADFHEMGTDSTYFFQPGVPSRQNPLTPARNLELTHDLARFHAAALDRAGSLYFTEERFDDFYYGKGSTYPDLNGAVGILFEQASARGHLQDSENGPLAFPFAVKNQLLTSLSTLDGALAKRRDLLDYQAEFYRTAGEQAAGDDLAAWVFGDPADPAREYHLLEVLHRHRIEVHRLGSAVEAEGQTFAAGGAWVVPLRQPQYRLVRTLFERRVDFPDTTFYDVSTWTAPLAFNLPHAALDRKAWRRELLGERLAEPIFPAGRFAAAADAVAYLFAWDAYYAPRALHTLLAEGVRARVATRPFSAAGGMGRQDFGRGTIVVPVGGATAGGQSVDRGRIEELLGELARRDAIAVNPAASGLTPEGVDLGSPGVEPLKLPAPALVVGRGVETYPTGEVWHLLDHRFGMPLAMIDSAELEKADLGPYTHLILVDGKYGDLPAATVERIQSWVRQGGVLVALQGAAVWAEEAILQPRPSAAAPASAPPVPGEAGPAATSDPRADAAGRRPYAEHAEDQAERLISGAIFEVELDLTHPLAFGYRRASLPVFRNSRHFLAPSADPYATFAAYGDSPLLSGYVSDDNLARLQQSPALIAERLERGAVIRMVDDPAFRAFWYGTDKLLLNALFFGSILEDTAPKP